MNSVTFEIGEIACRFNFNLDDIFDEVVDRYRPFIKEREPDVDFKVHIVETLDGLSKEQMSGLDPGMPEVAFEGSKIIYGRRDFITELEWEDGRATVRMLPNTYAFDAIYRLFYSLVTVRLGGMFLHSASLIRSEKGYVFTGVTESGKSEIAEMAGDESIYLTDELTVIIPRKGRFRCYGTPFWGLFAKGGANRGVPIEKLFFLKRDEETFEKTITAASALPTMMRNVLNFSIDAKHNGRLFENGMKFLDSTYFSELHCVPDPDIWPLVDKALDN